MDPWTIIGWIVVFLAGLIAFGISTLILLSIIGLSLGFAEAGRKRKNKKDSIVYKTDHIRAEKDSKYDSFLGN